MKKNINLNISADISLDTATDLLSEAIENYTGKQVKSIAGQYDDLGKFTGFHIVFSDTNSPKLDQVIDGSFRPMRFS